MEERQKLVNVFMEKNHKEYLEKSKMIGFMEALPEDPKGVIDEITVRTKCRNFDVSFKVRYGKVTFGKNNEFHCYGITTDAVDISHRLPLGGFNSMCCYDEADTMELAVTEMAKKHNLMICDKRCSWPHAKVVVQEVTDNFIGIRSKSDDLDKITREKKKYYNDLNKYGYDRARR